jgi:Tol biopolymer transport system component
MDAKIAFLAGHEDEWGLFTMFAVGGSLRKVLSGSSLSLCAPQGSADGTEIALSIHESGRNRVDILSLQTQHTRRIALPEFNGNPCLDLSWSPVGRFFARPEQRSAGNSTVGDPLSGGERVAITDGRTQVWSPSWASDGRKLFFVSNRRGIMDLWQQRIRRDGRPEGEPDPVTPGLEIRTARFSPDGSRLAYTRGGPVANVWRVPLLPDRPATWADAEQITFESSFVEHLDLSPDGKRRVVASDRA